MTAKLKNRVHKMTFQKQTNRTIQTQDTEETKYYEQLYKEQTINRPNDGTWCLKAVPQLMVPIDHNNSINIYKTNIYKYIKYLKLNLKKNNTIKNNLNKFSIIATISLIELIFE